MKRRTHSWDSEPEPIVTRRSATEPEKPIQRKRQQKTGFGGNPPVRIEMTLANGEKITMIGDQIDGDNPVIQNLLNVRSCARFWRLRRINVEKPEYFNDKEIKAEAAKRGFKTNDPVEAGEVLGCVAEWFLTDDEGEPKVDPDTGLWTLVDDPTTHRDFAPETRTAP